MIISRHSTRISYSVDAASHSLRATLAAPGTPCMARTTYLVRSRPLPKRVGALDLKGLYPQLFVAAVRPAILLRSARATAVTAAAIAIAVWRP